MTTAVAAVVLLVSRPAATVHAASENKDAAPKEPAALAAEIEKLKTLLPDQSHAMADVAYHMAHAWHAGHAANWPLAKFYVDETRSHIGWAVRIKPVRKGPGGVEFALQSYADAVFNGPLNDLKGAVERQDAAQFETAYKATLTACYACHVASDKPYLRLHVPAIPEGGVIDFAPAAK